YDGGSENSTTRESICAAIRIHGLPSRNSTDTGSSWSSSFGTTSGRRTRACSRPPARSYPRMRSGRSRNRFQPADRPIAARVLDVCGMSLRDHEHMPRVHRLDVHERERRTVLADNARRGFPADDLAEDTVADRGRHASDLSLLRGRSQDVLRDDQLLNLVRSLVQPEDAGVAEVALHVERAAES